MLGAPFFMKLKTFILNTNNFSCWKDYFIWRQWLFERLYWIWMNYSDFFFLFSPSPCLKKWKETANKSNVRKNETAAKMVVFNFILCHLVLFLRPETICSVCLASSTNGSNMIMSPSAVRRYCDSILIMQIHCCDILTTLLPSHLK